MDLKAKYKKRLARKQERLSELESMLKYDLFKTYSKKREAKDKIIALKSDIPKLQNKIKLIKTCPHCNKEFIGFERTYGKKSKLVWRNDYCTRRCYDLHNNINVHRYNRPKPQKKVCKECGKSFWTKSGVDLCSECYMLVFVTRCNNCGKLLKRNRRYIITEDKAEILRKQGYFKDNGAKHNFIIDNSKHYCDINCIIEKESPYYYEGINDEKYSLEFNDTLKNRIRGRDNNTCRLCGKSQEESERKFPVHHIDYNKSNNDSSNLITLCSHCHNKTNFNRKYWVNLFSTYIQFWILFEKIILRRDK